jgi:hypothetical protein
MAARKITVAQIKLFKQQANGGVEDVGEVLFSRFPVRSQSDYRCILADILDLQQAKDLSEDIQEHPNDSRGTAAGYMWQR